MQPWLQTLIKALTTFLASLQNAQIKTAPVPASPSPTPEPAIQAPVAPLPPTDSQSQQTGFLVCPIKGTDAVGNPLTSRTIKISAVIDHSGTAIEPGSGKKWGKNAKNQTVKAFNGEVGQGPQCPQEPCGYGNANSTEFFSNKEINYVGVSSDGGKKVLQYDGHAGYDFPYAINTQILAPADGKLRKGKNGEDVIYAAHWDKDHSFYIEHENGFVTWFRHCSSLEESIEQKIGLSPDGSVQVSKGECIARLGSFELGRVGGTAPHLHFEVRNKDKAIVDPYSDKLWADY